MMPLCAALRLLASVHTKHSDDLGWEVNSTPLTFLATAGTSDVREYVNAWAAVRHAVGMGDDTEAVDPPPK